MCQDRKLLLVHHFALTRVTGTTVVISDLLARLPAVRPATRVEYECYEAYPAPDGFARVLASRHSDADCVVAVNVHIDVGWPYTLRLLDWSRGGGRPLYLYVHDYWPHHRSTIQWLVAGHWARLLASTHYVRDALAHHGFDADLAPVGVPLSNVQVQSHNEARDAGPAVIASVGRLVPRKRFLDVVRGYAGARLGHRSSLLLRLLPSRVYPPDEDERILRLILAEVKELGVEGSIRIERKAVERSDYNRYAVYVCASQYEGLSMAPIEAAYSGCPPILSDIPAHRAIAEVLFPDLAPLVLYPTGDHWALAQLLSDEIATGRRSAHLTSRLGEIRTLVETHWSPTTTAQALAALLDRPGEQPPVASERHGAPSEAPRQGGNGRS